MLDIKKLLIKILLHLRHLPNYYNPNGGMNNRPTTANIDSDDTGSVIQFLSTSSMTTGKPKYDGNILHFNWDNSGKWASQLAIGHGDGNIQFRTQSDGATWSPWYDVCKRPHEITANTNLNNLKGLHFIYYCSGSATVATLTNCPTSNAFTMVVDDGTFGYERTSGNYIYLIQTVVDYQGSVWKRQIDTSDGGSTWTYRNWKRYIHSGLYSSTTVATTVSTTDFPQNYCYLFKIGDVVFISIALGNYATSSPRKYLPKDTVLFTLPSAYRPSAAVRIPAQLSLGDDNPYPASVQITTAGVVQITTTTRATGVYCFGMYKI